MPEPLFAKVSNVLDFPAEEREILRFWKSARIFEKTLAKPAKNGTFVFYEGPPTANGLPHNGHVLTRVIKDLFPRYKTMRGWNVPRKAGWDTHGLPVEVEVEKELRIHGKAAIVEYGVEPFVKKCLESVFRYTREWEDLTERVAFWVDLGDAYVTYHRSYVESVWWALSELFKKGLLYQGHKVVWWWAQGGTALSSGEVGQGYRTVNDPSVYVAFPLVDPPWWPARRAMGNLEDKEVALAVWTTTPWTLPSNMYAAVPSDDAITFQIVDAGERYLLVADKLAEQFAAKTKTTPTGHSIPAALLESTRYRPPFDLFAAEASGFESVVFTVIREDFVTLDTGTGVVHLAPAFGEDDHQAHRRLVRDHPSLPLFCAVQPDGTFIERFERYAGRWVKDCDKEIQHDLKDARLLIHAESYRHEYPFCWRADSDPLIQYARPAWYIRTTEVIDRAIANSREIQWLPEHIKEGRFGDFLAHNVDWALSRERWWGTPLNVWVCDQLAEHKEAPASIAEIELRNAHAFDHFHAARRVDPTLSEHLIIHKPWIDQVIFGCAKCAGTMRRVPEVIDCWFDSGCMPFAQWGYPHRGREEFERSFPADFISEAIDQTRGWFYSLLMISTLVFDGKPKPHPFKTCVVLGHVSDKEGKKESKSKGNYTPPEIVLDKVAMEFAVWDGKPGEPQAAVALVSREDLEGLDLPEGATVRIYRGDDPNGGVEVPVLVDKRLPRRVVVLAHEHRAKLGVLPSASRDIKPADVPRLPHEERVTIEDPSTSAPGADAFRWFFYAASPPWSATRHSLSNVRALQKEFAVKLRNVYSFFTIYANIDQFRPGAVPAVARKEQPELDRWICSELGDATRVVTARLDQYDAFGATQRLIALVDALSNWWVRRSRGRFWKSGWDDDKRSAYETLYECLVAIAKLTAPFTPYAAEAMYQNLVVRSGVSGSVESVHLEGWPDANAWEVDERLSRKIAAVRALVSLGLQVRYAAKIKVRQPLGAAYLIVADDDLREQLLTSGEMIREELNVLSHEIVGPDRVREFVEYKLKPNFRTLGQRGLGKQAQELKKAMGAFSADQAAGVVAALQATGRAKVQDVELEREDVEVAFETKGTLWAAGDRAGVVVLDTRLTTELRDLGFLRELLSRIQTMRKEMGLEYTDRIRVWVEGNERVCAIVHNHRDLLAAEVLAVQVSASPSAPHAPRGDPASALGDATLLDVEVEGENIRLGVARAISIK
jgi:isoleucyl-tRNA synthetase